MKTTTIVSRLALALPVVLWSAVAEAGPCLPAADQDAFEDDLVLAFQASPLAVDQLYDLAANRLGFGWTGKPGTRSHEALAEIIALRLATASDLGPTDLIDVDLVPLANQFSGADDDMATLY
nr:hypothetical protein [Deltaproteobacteria bacterium]